MNFAEKRIEQRIKQLWKKNFNTQSEAHFRAEEITRLEKLLKR
jgi:polyhydroxyalkanoate synthesis regulator phasin